MIVSERHASSHSAAAGPAEPRARWACPPCRLHAGARARTRRWRCRGTSSRRHTCCQPGTPRRTSRASPAWIVAASAGRRAGRAVMSARGSQPAHRCCGWPAGRDAPSPAWPAQGGPLPVWEHAPGRRQPCVRRSLHSQHTPAAHLQRDVEGVGLHAVLLPDGGRGVLRRQPRGPGWAVRLWVEGLLAGLRYGRQAARRAGGKRSPRICAEPWPS